MSRILAIATNTYREAVRDKIVYALLVVALLGICGAALVAEMTIGEYGRVLKDMGLAGINAVGLIIAVFVGIGLIHKELEQKTIYTIASKPIGRWEILVGKYLGLVATLLFEVGLMTLALVLVLVIQGVPVTALFLPALWLLLIELMVVTAIALLFGCFTAPSMATAFTLALVGIGRSTQGLVDVAESGSNEALKVLAQTIYRCTPDLRSFNLRPQAASGEAIEWEFVVYSTGYGGLWIGAFLALAILIFHIRDFK